MLSPTLIIGRRSRGGGSGESKSPKKLSPAPRKKTTDRRASTPYGGPVSFRLFPPFHGPPDRYHFRGQRSEATNYPIHQEPSDSMDQNRRKQRKQSQFSPFPLFSPVPSD